MYTHKSSIKAWNLLSYNMKFIIRGHTDDIEVEGTAVY